MILALVLACGGGQPEKALVQGCWRGLPKKTTVECFLPDGKYTIAGPRLGSLEGKWALDGTLLTLNVAQFPADTYEVSKSGENLVMARTGGKTREYEPEPQVR